jgi:hypothetical protein
MQWYAKTVQNFTIRFIMINPNILKLCQQAKRLSCVTREHLTSSQRKDLISLKTDKMNRLEAEQVTTRYQQHLTQCRNETKTL